MHHFYLNDYKIVEEIGVGGMARVYKAVQLKLDRFVVIKEMSPALYKDPSFRERFAREAKICAKLSHPHIVQIYDVVVQENGSYLAIEYIEGGDLSELMKGPVDINKVFQLVNEMCSALDYAHSKGIIHRDVKKQNILIRANGCFVLADFGIAKAGDMGTQMTMVGSAVGSPKYMSPEQAQGEQIDGRSDYYSLGIVLFEILTGMVPYNADSSIAVALQHLNAPIPKMPSAFSALDPFFEKILAKSPDHRYADGQEVIEGFIQCIKHIDEKILALSIEHSQNIQLNKLGNSGSYKAKTTNVVTRDKNKMNFVYAGLTAIGVMLGIGFYLNHSHQSENIFVQGKLASAYKNLQSGNFSQALLEFKSVLDADPDNEVAIDSISSTKKILFEKLQHLLQQKKFETIKAELDTLRNQFGDDKEYSNFLLKYEQAKLISLAQKNTAKQIERLEYFFKQAEESNRLIYPENDNAVMYLKEIIALQPERAMATNIAIDKIQKLSVKQIELIIKEKNFYLAETLLLQYEKLFGKTSDYKRITKDINDSRVTGETRPTNDAEKLSVEQSKFFVSNFNTMNSTKDNFYEFYENADKYLSIHGDDDIAVKKINDVINKNIEKIESLEIDDIYFNKMPELRKYQELTSHQSVKTNYLRLLSIFSKKVTDSKRVSLIINRIGNANTAKITETQEIINLLKDLHYIIDSKVSVAKTKNLKISISEIVYRTVEKLSENKNYDQAINVLEEALDTKFIDNNSQLTDTLARMRSIEQTAKENVTVQIDKIVNAINSNRLFPPTPDNAIDQLQAPTTQKLLSQQEYTRLIELVYESSLKSLRRLFEEKKYDELFKLYTTTTQYWLKIPPSKSTKDSIVQIAEQTANLTNQHAAASDLFQKRKIEVSKALENEDIEKALITLQEINANKQEIPSELLATLGELKTNTHTFLLTVLDKNIEEKEVTFSEALVVLSSEVFPNDKELELRRDKIKALKEKKVKIIGF